MPRHSKYEFICDKCGNSNVKPNDENDVSFNSRKLVFCQNCYDDLMSLYEQWESWDVNALTAEMLNERITHNFDLLAALKKARGEAE